MKDLQKIFWFLIDYGPSIVTLSFGVYVALAPELYQMPVEQLVKWALIMLTLIATTQLVDRLRSLRLIDNKIDQVTTLIQENRETSLFHHHDDRPTLPNMAMEAVEIDVLAWSGIILYKGYERFWEDKIRNGCKVRFMIVDPDSKAAQVIMENSRHGELNADAEAMINRYKTLRGEMAGTDVSINFELRLTQWLVPYGLIIVDGDSPKGYLSVGLHPAYLPTPQDSRRYIGIEKQSNEEDFNYFRDQYEAAWNNAVPVELFDEQK